MSNIYELSLRDIKRSIYIYTVTKYQVNIVGITLILMQISLVFTIFQIL